MTTPREFTIKFANLLQDAKLPLNLYPAARQAGVSWRLLSQLQKGALPSNHPYIARLAKALHTSEATIRFFAHGRELSTKEELRLTSRLSSNGTHDANNGNGRRKTAVKNDSRKEAQRHFALRRSQARAAEGNKLVAARLEREMTAAEVAIKADVSTATVRSFENGGVPPNSPMLAALAPLYGLSLEEAQAVSKRPPMSEDTLRAAVKRAKAIRNSGGLKSNMTQYRRADRRAAVVRSPVATADGVAPKAKTRVLRKMDPARREALRTLTNTVNVNAMRGTKETTVTTQMLADFLREYYTAIGVEENVVLDFAFDRIFD
jgi:transcriptional regulator with XRE-family HTH domain